ncbi:MAG: ABC transporter transmembrane domain-containing protein [Bdellovibrionia bacterium]
MLFSSISPLIRLGRQKFLDFSDLVLLPSELHPQWQEDFKFHGHWRGVFLRLIKKYFGYLKWAYSAYGIALVFQLLSPVFIHNFVTRLEKLSDQPELWLEVVFFAMALGLSGVITGVCYQLYFYSTLRTYQKITNLLNVSIFKHTLKLSRGAQQKSAVGDVVNHMSSDSESVSDMPLIVADLVWAFGTIFVVCLMLFYYIGLSALLPILLMGLLAPVSRFIAKEYLKSEELMLEVRDQRVTLMTQVLSAIRLIKYFSWEAPISEEVMKIRNREIQHKRKIANLEVASGFIFLILSTVVLLVTFWVHYLRGFQLDAALIFTLIALFGLMEEPFASLARLIGRFTAAKVGISRIQDFLAREKNLPSRLISQENIFELRGASFKYPEQQSLALTNLNLEIKRGEAIAIVGPVGGGKSSFLLGLLGEIPLVAGGYKHQPSSCAYVPQEAYIVNSSLLENINFGFSVSDEEFRKALHLSCLDKDVRELPGGLRTEIGERGVNLSGGQKQRVSLARAVVAKPEVLLLDDPLSAVDPHTEDLLIERLLFGHWQGLTRLVVTHRLAHLEKFDRILYIKKGEIRAMGSFSELMVTSQDFRDLVQMHQNEVRAAAQVQVSHASSDAETVNTESRQTEDEDRELGAVKKTIYFDYLKSLGGNKKSLAFLLIIGSLLATVMPLLQKYWLADFSRRSEEISTVMALNVYAVLGVAVLLSNISSHLLWLRRGISAGVEMHNQMLKGVMNAPIRFFDSTPVGRILQRFSRDQESVDFNLQFSFESAFYCLFQILVALVFIAVLLPGLILLIIPVGALYYRIQKDYRAPAREVKRLDSIKRSPRFAHFKETLQGLVVIRAFKQEQWFADQFLHKLTESQVAFYNHYMLNRWFSSRVPLIAGLISISTCLGLSFAVREGALAPGVAGLAAIYSLSFWGYLNWAVRVFSEIESRLTSVERIQFMAKIESEQSVVGESSLESGWVPRGEIEFRNVCARYAQHLPLVLKDVSFKIPQGSKVGIVGRTGSGKSTVFQALYRLFELESGTVFMDGVPAHKIPLDKLRRHIAIVPQDATLFMGTIRSNLDRFEQFTDAQIESVLRRVYLWDFVKKLRDGIDTPVSENGINFSLGQRQLFCLARALLIQAKIVILDESTASVDVVTDSLIQRVLKESLSDVTVLIIAHRLGTLTDVDFVIELQDGTVKSIKP